MTEFLGPNLASSHLLYIFHKYSCQYSEYSIYDLEYVFHCTISYSFKGIRKGNPLTLLVGMQTGTATMENSVEIS